MNSSAALIKYLVLTEYVSRASCNAGSTSGKLVFTKVMYGKRPLASAISKSRVVQMVNGNY